MPARSTRCSRRRRCAICALIAGKVLMDRNAPPALTDTARSGYDQSKALIEKWHGRGRCLYAITPRFAVTSTPEQLELAGACGASIPTCSCKPTSPRTSMRSTGCRKLYPRAARLSRRLRPLWTDRPARGAGPRRASRGERLRALPRERNGAGALSDLKSVSRQRAISAAHGARSAPSGRMSASAPISAPAPAFRCSRPWAKPTRWRSCNAARSTPSRHSFSLPSAAPARSRSTTSIGTLARRT